MRLRAISVEQTAHYLTRPDGHLGYPRRQDRTGTALQTTSPLASNLHAAFNLNAAHASRLRQYAHH
jgi:hypothetical protein